MKKMYWRPQRMSLRVLLLLATLSSLSVLGVETLRVRQRQPMYREKLAAARLARKAFFSIKRAREAHNLPVDPQVDPARSGLIGELISSVTTNTGHLPAKQTSVNPNFAAVVVELLRRAEVEPKDLVAVGLSGSFPALNVATLTALKSLGMRALVISSAGASQWGANHVRFMWPDMERVLFKSGLIGQQSLAVSLGGIDDRALGLSRRGKQRIRAAIERNALRFLETKDYADGLNQRMTLYQEHAGAQEIRCYINVGGGTISVGTHVGKDLFKPGLNRRVPRGANRIDSVMSRFADRGVPVIHLSKISKLAGRYGLPLQPTNLPRIGEGRVFIQQSYNIWLAAGALALLLIMLVAFLRLDLGHRLFNAGRKESNTSTPEPMI